MLMPLALGVLAGLATALLGAAAGLDRDRAYYPTLLMVIAAYYILFAAMAGSPSVLARESIAMAAFFAVAIAGFRRSLPLVAGGLLAHGLFDLVHGRVIANPGVPGWWPPFCMAADIALAACLAWRLRRAVPEPGISVRSTGR